MTTPIIMCGAAGRMGITIMRGAAEDSDFSIAAGLDMPGIPAVGKTVGELIGLPDETAPVVGSLDELPDGGGPVAIHFSAPEATLAQMVWSVERGLPVVIGTRVSTPTRRPRSRLPPRRSRLSTLRI